MRHARLVTSGFVKALATFVTAVVLGAMTTSGLVGDADQGPIIRLVGNED